jgi:hypothetical protein
MGQGIAITLDFSLQRPRSPSPWTWACFPPSTGHGASRRRPGVVRREKKGRGPPGAARVLPGNGGVHRPQSSQCLLGSLAAAAESAQRRPCRASGAPNGCRKAIVSRLLCPSHPFEKSRLRYVPSVQMQGANTHDRSQRLASRWRRTHSRDAVEAAGEPPPGRAAEGVLRNTRLPAMSAAAAMAAAAEQKDMGWMKVGKVAKKPKLVRWLARARRRCPSGALFVVAVGAWRHRDARAGGARI